ncbi:MAG: hypothetical protein IJB88_04045 [Clostridia bacterium]|nr:hypothetical protein [Clostridia bacterium]
MKYELKKLFSQRFFLFFMLLLLAANCVLAYSAAPSDKAWNRALDDFWTCYHAAPVYFDTQYDAYTTAREHAISMQIEAVLRGEDPEKYAFEEPRTISPDSGYTDVEFYNALYGRKGYGERYREKLDRILTDTENSLQVVTDPYMTEYLHEVRATYTAMYSLSHSENRISGWDAYFAYDSMGILLLFAVVAAAWLFASADSGRGTEQLLFASTKGACGVVRQKILALLVFCAIGTAVFEASAFAMFCTKTTFAGADAFLASAESYLLCPYAVYIYEYALLRVVIRFAVLFSAGIFLLFAARMLPLVFGYPAFFVAFLGIQYAMKNSQTTPGTAYRALNLFYMLEPSHYFKRYSSVDLCGRSVPFLPAGAVLCAALLIVCTVLLLFQWKKTPKRKRFMPKFPVFLTYTPRTSFGFECKKLLISQKLLLPLILLLVIKAMICTAAMQQSVSYREQIYRNYMLTFQGLTIDETERALEQEHKKFLGLFAASEENSQRYANGEITYTELLASNLKKRTAEKKYEIFLDVKAEYERIQSLSCQGINAELVYGTGWKKLLSGAPDLLLLLVPITASFAYTAENKAKLRPVLHATPGGRTRMFLHKLFICNAYAVLWCVLFGLADLWWISETFTLPVWNAASASVPELADAIGVPTLGGAFFAMLAKRICMTSILTCTAVCIAQTAKSFLASPLVCFAGIFAPHLLSLLLGGWTKYLSVPNLYCFPPLPDPKSIPLAVFCFGIFAVLLFKTIRKLSAD